MKTKTKLVSIALTTLLIGACSNNATIDEQRTIILEVDSEFIPTFSSNYGSGNYDPENGIYTHTIKSIKDVYITLSYEDLKPVTVYIPTSEMTNTTITKNIEFGDSLDAEVEVTIEGLKSLEGIEFEENTNISNLKLGKKNTFTFTLPSREENYQINFSIPGYREFTVDINKEHLVSGMAKLSAVALNSDQIYVALDGASYWYQIYSTSTNKLVSSGNKYSSPNNTREYVLLPNNDSYYILVNYYNGNTDLYNLNQNEDFVIKGSISNTDYGYLHVNFSENENISPSYRIYDKVNKTLSYGTMTNMVSSLGLIVLDNNDNWVYIDEITTTHKGDDTNNHYYTIDYSKAIPIKFNITRMHTFTNEIISTGIEENFNIFDGWIDEAELIDDTFNITIHQNESQEITIDLYDKNNNTIGNIEYYVGMRFYESILSGTINYQGKKIPYQFPLFKEDLVYKNGTFTYIGKPIVNTDISLIEIVYINESGNIGWLPNSSYILGPDGLPILKTDINDGKTYFELEQDVNYTLHNNNKTYEFTLTENDYNNGNVIIWDSAAKYTPIKVPNDYYLIFDNINLYPNSDNIVNYPLGEHKSNDEVILSNGIVTLRIDKPLHENQLIELKPFYTLALNSHMISYNENYKLTYTQDNDGKLYYYIDHENDATTVVTNLYSEQNGYLSIPLSNFIYNNDLKASYYSIEENSAYILTGDAHQLNYNNCEYYIYDNKYYIKTGNIVRYNDVDYDLSIYSGKKLNVQIYFEGSTFKAHFIEEN